jgi:hypothetical protein
MALFPFVVCTGALLLALLLVLWLLPRLGVGRGTLR